MAKTGRVPVDPMVRFMAHVAVTDSCWLWTGSCLPSGYAQFSVGSRSDSSRRTVRAHKWLWEKKQGPVPDGLELDHVKELGCLSRNCVNDVHLEPVTRQENIARRDK